MIQRKKITSICLAILLILVIAAGGTLAYVYSSNTKVNTFKIGENVSNITEEFTTPTDEQMIPGGTVKKDVRVTNTGMPSFVRVYIAISSSDFEETFSIDWNTTDWSKSEDGYWYYNKIVGENETTEPIMTTVTFNDKITDFKSKIKNSEGIAVYEETVQAEGFDNAKDAFNAIQ